MDYQKRMSEYYPKVVWDILDIQAIIYAEYPEFGLIDGRREFVQNEAYWRTMSEDRIAQWEELLGIAPIDVNDIEERRNTVIARLLSQSKLNTESIQTIVKTYTGGTCNAYVKDSVIHVEVYKPKGSKTLNLEAIRLELERRKPAHLGLVVERAFRTWGAVADTWDTWQGAADDSPTWEDVYLY